MSLIHHLYEVSDNERDGLDSLELFFGSDLLSPELLLVLLDELLLYPENLEVLFEFLQLLVLVLDFGVGLWWLRLCLYFHLKLFQIL